MTGRQLTLAVLLGSSLATSSAYAQEDDVEIPAKPAATTQPSPPAPAPEKSTPAQPAPAQAAPAQAPAAAQAPAQAPAPAAHEGPTTPPREADVAPPVRGTREPSLTRGLAGPLGVYASGYVQAQYENSQLSEDQLQQGGLPLNQDRFLVRRARLRLDRAWQWAHAAIEIDGNTTRGPTFGLRRAEASLLYRNASDPDAPPWVRLTAGLSEIPFGYELTDSSRSRVFMERSTGSLALFPGEPDVGIRVSGGAAFFRYSLAAINGEPIDDRPGRQARDPNSAKDIVGRLGVETTLRDDPEKKAHLKLSGGVSFLTGKGFHPGTEATKNSVVWRDLNENGVLDAGELTAIPATAAVPSQNFDRWAIGADLGVSLDTKLGRSRLYGEVFVAQNADRGLFIADPIATGSDVRELGWYVAFLQEVTRWSIVGFRADRYDPNADFLDKRVGKLVPSDASITTLSPLVGATLPDHMRVVFQYDAILDKLARDASGVPTDLRNDQLTLRIQGEL
ncbi:MAG TPA: hypothetical protein VM925_15835 [Labilithrix sp.]|nr:hypothetical protein [Labilithrix sp.]